MRCGIYPFYLNRFGRSAIRVFRNGVFQNFGNFTAPINYDNQQNLLLAAAVNRSNQGINRFWNGRLDEFMFFDRALADAEITGIFNSGAAGVCLNSVGYEPRKNGKIAFQRRIGRENEQIFTINEDGTNLNNLTNNSRSFHYNANYSPDGTKIAYARDRTIYIADSNGFNPFPLLNEHFGEESLPRWSPDGNKIAFAEIRRKFTLSTSTARV